MSKSTAAWKLAGPQTASLDCGPLRGVAYCDEGGISFVPSSWNGAAVDSMKVLASTGPDHQAELRLAELYIRGTDLVADFVAAGPHRIAPQVYWRTAFEPQVRAIRIELVLSVRTELLESAPSWSVTSIAKNSFLLHADRLDASAFEETPQARTFRHGDRLEHLFVFRNHGLGLSYAEMVHPSDFVMAEATQGQQPSSVRSTLFPEHLEKGVIRRGRICGWFMPSENDLETAVRLARKFVEEPLPLTT